MMPRKLLLVALVTALFPTAAQARPRPGGQLGGRSFEANKTFGLGLELGSLAGITGKVFVSERGAIDFGVGTLFTNGNRSQSIHLYGDYLFHPISLASIEAFELPLYFGIGGRFWHFSELFDPAGVNLSASVAGVRAPIGVAFDFNNLPLDAFVQVVPTLDYYSYSSNNGFNNLVSNGLALDFDVTIGARYWFK